MAFTTFPPHYADTFWDAHMGFGSTDAYEAHQRGIVNASMRQALQDQKNMAVRAMMDAAPYVPTGLTSVASADVRLSLHLSSGMVPAEVQRDKRLLLC